MGAIHLNLKPAYVLSAILVGAGTTACLILAFMPITLMLKLVSMVLVVTSTVYHVMDALQRLPWSIIYLELNSKGELHITQRDESKQPAMILGDSVVLAYLTILNLKMPNKRWHRHVLITPDRVESDAFRRLRVCLRWGRHEISDAEAPEET